MKDLLNQLVNSEMVHRLSLMLMHSLWQGVVVAVALALLWRLMRRATARAKHAAACFALLAMAVWPALTFCELARDSRDIVEAPWLRMSSAPDNIPSSKPPLFTGSPNVESGTATAAVPQPAPEKVSATWQCWIVMSWLAGVTLLCVWHTLGWLGLRRLRRASTQTVSGELAGMAARLAVRMQISPSVRVYWSARVSGAISFGWWRPVVLLPVAMATGCSTKEVEMILAHEYAHLRRHDYLVNMLQSVVETLFFYHPAVWWISRRIRREREHACDDAAIRATGDTAGYARALLQMAARASTPTPRLALAARGKGELRTRIERLLQPMQSATSSPLRPVWGMAMLVTVLLAVTAPDIVRPLNAEDVAPLGARGSIRDRNGVPLAVSDRQDRQIVFNLEKVVLAWRAKPGREVPMITYARPKDGGGTEDVQEPNIVYLFEQLVVPALESHQLAHPFNANAMRVNYRERKRERPFVYTNDLPEETAKRAAALKGEIPGMDTRTIFLRHYPFKSMASHLLGYVNQPASASYFNQSGETGVGGIEKSMESMLAPPSGDAGTNEEPNRGTDVYLTLDVRHQYIVERALRDSQPAIGRGAVVLLDVSNGDVLAMASAPSYDPNDFIPTISKERFEEYNDNATIPLLNRAVRSFVPGATFLIATSLAGICDGKEGFQHTCTGGSTFGNRYMQCWIAQKGGTHGQMDLRKGMEESCNPYFYNLGNAINNDKFDAVISLLGIGQDLGIGLPENDSGIFPNRAWWEKHRPREPYTAATVANLSIGQGALQASPLQLASLLVPVANGGQVWRPRLVDRIAPAGDVSSEEKRPRQLAGNLRDQGLTDSGLETLRSAMRATVTEGTAQMANLPELPIAGRTGTAQNWRIAEGGVSLKDNHTIFIAYAPAEKPKWAICVLVQGSLAGGRTAAPIAAHILSQVAEVEAGKRTVHPQALEPIVGNFDRVDRVKYPLISK